MFTAGTFSLKKFTILSKSSRQYSRFLSPNTESDPDGTGTCRKPLTRGCFKISAIKQICHSYSHHTSIENHFNVASTSLYKSSGKDVSMSRPKVSVTSEVNHIIPTQRFPFHEPTSEHQRRHEKMCKSI